MWNKKVIMHAEILYSQRCTNYDNTFYKVLSIVICILHEEFMGTYLLLFPPCWVAF